MFKIIAGIILGLIAFIYLINLGGIQVSSSLQAISALLEIVVLGFSSVWLIKTGSKQRKGLILRTKIPFMHFIKRLFRDPVEFLKEHSKEAYPPYWLFMLWVFGMAHLHQIFRLVVIGRPEMADGNTWAVLWPMSLIMGLFWGVFLYTVFGALLHGLIRLSRGTSTFKQSANILLYSNIYLYAAIIFSRLIYALFLGDGYFYGEGNFIIVGILTLTVLASALYSARKLYASAVALTHANRLLAVNFIVIPFLAIVILLSWVKSNALYLSRSGLSNLKAIEAMQTGDVVKAEVLFNQTAQVLKSEKNFTDLAKAYANQGILYESTGQPSKASALFEEALTAIPADMAGHYTLQGLLFINQGKAADAINAFGQAVKLDPNDFNANNRLGLIYMGRYGESLKDANKALAFNKKALALNQDDPAVIQNLALNYFDLNDFKAAFPLLKTLYAGIPENKLTVYYLGVTYYRLGDADAARKLLAPLVKTNPEIMNEVVREILGENGVK